MKPKSRQTLLLRSVALILFWVGGRVLGGVRCPREAESTRRPSLTHSFPLLLLAHPVLLIPALSLSLFPSFPLPLSVSCCLFFVPFFLLFASFSSLLLSPIFPPFFPPYPFTLFSSFPFLPSCPSFFIFIFIVFD